MKAKKNEGATRRRSMVASITVEDADGRTTLYGPAEPDRVPEETHAPKDPKECAKLRRVECERCLRYGGAPGRYGASCPFRMGEEDEKL